MRVSQAMVLIVMAGALSLPAAAQRAPTTPAPAPEATPRACVNCDDELEALRAKLDAQRREVDRRYDVARDKYDAMNEKSDSVSRASYEDAARQYAVSKRAFDETAMRLMTLEAERMSREAANFAFKFNETRPRPPSGWLGINFIASYSIVSDSGRKRMIFSEYPVIEGVEPGSPAEKAGVESRDVLIALGGRDLLKGTLTFNDLLKPGTKVTLKLKRGRTTLDRVAVIERRPSSWGRMEDMQPMPVEAPDAPEPPEGPGMMSPPTMPRVMVAPRALGQGPSVSVWWDNLTIAGAHVQQFNTSALKEYFGVDSGLLVLSVLPGTPAARAGLKDGDVIVRASGRSVTTPAQFSRLVERARDGAISIDIVRQRKKQTLEMTW